MCFSNATFFLFFLMVSSVNRSNICIHAWKSQKSVSSYYRYRVSEDMGSFQYMGLS